MRLDGCPGCGSEVSAVAGVCPGCGWRSRTGRTDERSRKRWKTLGVCGALICVVGIAMVASSIFLMSVHFRRISILHETVTSGEGSSRDFPVEEWKDDLEDDRYWVPAVLTAGLLLCPAGVAIVAHSVAMSHAGTRKKAPPIPD